MPAPLTTNIRTPLPKRHLGTEVQLVPHQRYTAKELIEVSVIMFSYRFSSLVYSHLLSIFPIKYRKFFLRTFTITDWTPLAYHSRQMYQV